jgi:dipeptidyl aminopeptidase/acylaminoacyl peptidase
MHSPFSLDIRDSQLLNKIQILQGEIDRVVPKEQAEAIVDSIKARGGVVEYELYSGEGHGWRQEKNIKDALEREIAFYNNVLKLKK